MARIGYIRVSTIEQTLARQEDALSTLNLDRIFSDQMSGKNQERPALQEMLSYLREGDTLFVESISRISRSTRDLLSIIDRLNEKKVAFVSLKERIDTSSAQGQFVLTIFGALAELERAAILQRQREGIASAKLRGKQLGRPRLSIPETWSKVYSRWQSGEITATTAMRELGMSRTSFYQYVKEWQRRVA